MAKTEKHTMTKQQVQKIFKEGVNNYKKYKANNPTGKKQLKIFIKAAFKDAKK